MARGAAIRAGLDARRSKKVLEREWYPCLWCGAAIALDRVKDAILRGQQPKYCGEPCRRNELAPSLVVAIYAAAAVATNDTNDELEWKAEFDSRVDTATTKIPRFLKGKK